MSTAPTVSSTMLMWWLDWIYSTALIVSSTMLTWWLDWIYTQINDFVCVDFFLSWGEKRIETVLLYCNDCENVRALYCVHSRALYCMFNRYVWALCLNWIISKCLGVGVTLFVGEVRWKSEQSILWWNSRKQTSNCETLYGIYWIA